MSGQTNPDARAVFLAALEYGISPIARADYSKRETVVIEVHAHQTDTPIRRIEHDARRSLAVYTPQRLVVTAADILAKVNA